MLLIEKSGKTHYPKIENLNRLLYDSSKHKEHKHFCERCLRGYRREDKLEAHKPECRGIGQTAVWVDMPKEDENKLAFQNHHKQLPAPYIIYADFEALIAKVKGPEPDPAKSNTQRTQHHEACSYSYIVVRCDGHTEPPIEYPGPNAAGHFLESLQEERRKIKALLADPKARWWQGGTGMPSAPLRRATYVTNLLRVTPCVTTATLQVNIEGRPILPATSSYGYPQNHHYPRCLPQSAWLWLPLADAGHLEGGGRVHCIPNNTEKYISFSLGQLRFIDSVQFLLASLDRLVAANPPEAFRITAQHEPDRERRELLLCKGVYPYKYMDNWDHFAEPKLPPKEAFYSKLSDAHISDEDYTHVQKVWKAFGCKTLGKYSDLYCRTDVLLLADVFEMFRKTCLHQYGLDPAHYYTSPGLSWDALLKKTGVELELLTDYDQHLFIEKGLWGGNLMASKHYAKAQYPHLILRCKQSLRLGHESVSPHQWLSVGGLLPTTRKNHCRASGRRAWGLHTWGGPGVSRGPTQCQQFISAGTRVHGGSEGVDVGVSARPPQCWAAPTEVEKLVPNIRNKSRYVLHYRNLQLYMYLRLTAVHCALWFHKSLWMEPYIRMNTELRKKATSGFEKDLYKLMNNSVFGKTMENLRKWVDVKLVRTNSGASSPARRLLGPISSSMTAAIQVHKSHLELNRPV